MSRIVVPEEELLRVLNARLKGYEECADCRFTSLLRLEGARPDGCNWVTANLRCSGAPASPCQSIAQSVVAEVAETHNVGD